MKEEGISERTNENICTFLLIYDGQAVIDMLQGSHSPSCCSVHLCNERNEHQAEVWQTYGVHIMYGIHIMYGVHIMFGVHTLYGVHSPTAAKDGVREDSRSLTLYNLLLEPSRSRGRSPV